MNQSGTAMTGDHTPTQPYGGPSDRQPAAPPRVRQAPDLLPVRWRAVAIALLVAVIGIRFETASQLLRGGVSLELLLPWLTLFLLVALQPALSRLLRLQRHDVIVIFAFVLIAASCFDGVNRFMPAYTAARYFATPENGFRELADSYIPAWFAPTDEEVIRVYYEGSGDEPASLRPWLAPMGLWVLFFMALWGTLYCITALLRRYWVEHERLAFPLVTVPLYIAGIGSGRIRPRRSVWGEPLMWVGFVIAFLHILSIMLNALNPNVPSLRTYTDLGRFFTERPLDSLRPNFLFVYNPTLVGLAYFAPQDLCFSMWFFFLFYFKPLQLFYGVSGLRQPSGFPFYWEQAAGASVAIAAFYLWAARGYLRRLLRAASSGSGLAGPGEEHPWADPLTARTALVAAACGFAALCLWFVVAGMSWWVAGAFFGLTVLFATIFTRGRAESGVGALWSFPFWQAARQIKSFAGSELLSPGGNLANVTLLGSLVFLHFGSFPETMTHQIEALRMGEQCRVRTSHTTALVMGAMFVGLVVAIYTQLTLAMEYGANSLSGGTTEGGYAVYLTRAEFEEAHRIADGQQLRPDWARNGYTIAALLFTLLLAAGRVRFPRSPFHPIGFVMTAPYGYAYWGPYFTAWAAKAVILRLGGGRLYHQLAPVFVGLVLGQVFACTVVWPIFALFCSDEWRAAADPLAFF